MRPGSNRAEAGAALVVALAVMTGLLALIAVLASANGEAVRAHWNRMQIGRAQLMAEAGIQRAVAELQSADPKRVTQSDDWAKLGDRGATSFSLGNDSFRVQILDAGSRVNLNTADQDTLKKLPLTDEQVDSLLDWRDTTNTPTPRPQGGKDEYYNNLTTPYNTKLQTLSSVQELLLVKGFTPSDVYPSAAGGSTSGGSGGLSELVTTDSNAQDKDINGNPKLDVNTATPDQLVAIGVPPDVANSIMQARGGGLTKLGDVLKLPFMTKAAAHALADSATVGADKPKAGLINLNTAPEAVLKSVPGLEPDVVSAIVDRQSTGFRGLGDLADIPNVEVPVLAAIVDRFCVGSRAFIVRVIGAAGVSRYAEEALVTFNDQGQAMVSRIETVHLTDVPAQWGWPEKASKETNLGSG